MSEEPWPPLPPDITLRELIEGLGPVIGRGGIRMVKSYKEEFASKPASQREFDMMKLAGNCSVPPLARAMRKVVEESGFCYVHITNIIMQRGECLPWRDLGHGDLPQVRDDMIQLIETLHQQYRMVHGDVKPDHMIRCKDGMIRLCDFAEARPIDENPKKWRGQATIMYTSPNRKFLVTDAAPTVSDDLFALGLCIWQIYVKRRPFPPEMDEEDIEDSLSEGKVVDVMEIGDVETRKIVSRYLAHGGARIENMDDEAVQKSSA
jgi:serine/threonine protein kinase